MAGTDQPRQWDPLVRITHWGIAVAVIVNGLILEGGDEAHILVGYAALSLLALRLVWGLVGTEEARFTAFPPSPRAAISHLRGIFAGRVDSHRSHNPLGALMVYAVWATLAVIIATGLAMEGDVFPETAERHAFLQPEVLPGAAITLADLEEEDDDQDAEGEDGNEWLEEVHETAANLLLVLAVIHVGGVVFEMARGDRGLIRRMTTGTDDSGHGGGQGT